MPAGISNISAPRVTSMRVDLLKATVSALVQALPELADDETLKLDTLEGETDFNHVISRLVRQSNERGAFAEASMQLSADYRGRAERERAAQKAIRNGIIELMQAAGLQGLKLPEATLSLRAPSLSVDVSDVNALPQGYFTEVTTRIPGKEAIKEAFLAGNEIPGAAIVTGEPVLTVRIK